MSAVAARAVSPSRTLDEMNHLRARALASLAAILAIACSSPAAPVTDAGPRDDAGAAPDGGGLVALTVVPTGARASTPIAAAEGGTITLAGAEHTYTLEITPGALAADTEITLEEVTVPELPSALAVRFSPDGLVFDIPALLRVDAPYDEPMLALAFRASEPGVEMSFAAPLEGLAMPIEHFSEAALVPAADAGPALDAEQAAEVAEVTETARSQGLGLGNLLLGRITLMVDEFGPFGRVIDYEIAATELDRAEASMMVATLEDQNARRFGSQPVLEVIDALKTMLVTKVTELHANITADRCAGSADVITILDWARVVHRLRAAMGEHGIVLPQPTLCATTRIRVMSTPDHLEPATDEVVLSRVVLEIVGPGASPGAELIGVSFFTFAAVGASGPTDVPSATGELTDVRFLRPAGPARVPAVTITIGGHTSDTMLGGLPTPAPVTVRVTEPASFAGHVDVSSSCGTVSTTPIDCGGGPFAAEVRDLGGYAWSGDLRVSVAGDAVAVEATSVLGSRYAIHEVNENVMPSVDETLDSVATASGTREPDGRIRVEVCGPTTETTRRYPDACGSPSSDSTRATTACWQLLVAPTPAADPTELAPAPIVLGCGSEMPSASGTLARE